MAQRQLPLVIAELENEGEGRGGMEGRNVD
jgi:hypothetical protein